MTIVQKTLSAYLSQQFMGANLIPVGEDRIAVEGPDGNRTEYMVNLYCDIIDAESQMLVARSNVPHTMEWLLLNVNHIPEKWTNNAQYFGRCEFTKKQEILNKESQDT